MSENRDNHDMRGGQAGRLPADVARLGAALDARGRAQRDGLSAEALDRITAMSDLQLPIAGSDEPVVLARIEPSGPSFWSSQRVWRIAAAVAVVAGLGAAAVFLSRGFGGDSDSSNAPSEGTLVDGSKVPAPVPAVPSAVPVPKLAPEHLEHALASGAHSASTVVVALSAPVNEPAVHYHDLDDALAADIAPLFHAGSLLDGSGITYDDLSSEFAAIVAPKPFR